MRHRLRYQFEQRCRGGACARSEGIGALIALSKLTRGLNEKCDIILHRRFGGWIGIFGEKLAQRPQRV